MPDDSATPAPEALAGGEEQPQPTTPSDQPGAGEVAGAPSPDEQPVVDMVSAEEAQKRLSGLQSAFERKIYLEKQARQQAEVERDAAVTRDMTEEQRKKYDFDKRTATQDERDQELQQREEALREYDTVVEFRAFYTDMGVPPGVFANAATYDEVQQAAHRFIGGTLKKPAPSAEPSGPAPGDKVQTGTGASAPGSDFDEYVAEHGINPFSPEYKKLRKRYLREKTIT